MESENKIIGDHEEENIARVPHAHTTCAYGGLSHADLTELFQQSIKQMVISDPLLRDVHLQVSSDEVEALVALERGQAMTIIVERANGDPWKVVVSRDSTLHQLKMALKHHATLQLSRRGNFKKISWKYIWRTYDISFDGRQLSDNNKKLITYGLSNKSIVKFVKRTRKSNNSLKPIRENKEKNS